MMASLSMISTIRLTARWFEMRYAGLVLGIVSNVRYVRWDVSTICRAAGALSRRLA